MIDFKIVEVENNKDVTDIFKRKISTISFSESLDNRADNISIFMNNAENDNDFFPDSYFVDRNLSFSISFGGLNAGTFNIDKIDFEKSSSSGNLITLNGLSCPVTTKKSIYTKIRKVWVKKDFESILKELASIVGYNLSYYFDSFKTELQCQDEYIANVFQRLAEKYGAITKFYSVGLDNFIVFYGKKDLADYAREEKESAIAFQAERESKIIIIDKNDKTTLENIESIDLSLVTHRKELKVVWYSPSKKRTYRKLAKNKFNLLLEDSVKDYEVVKCSSQEEADIISKKVENEPAVTGSIRSQFSKRYLSGNIIEIKNFGTIRNGIYLITSSSHNIGTGGNFSNITLEKLPD